MPHEIERLLAAAAQDVWLIEPGKAWQILNVLALRAERAHEPVFRSRRAPPPDDEGAPTQQAGPQAQVLPSAAGNVHVIPVHGSIFPRANILSDFSGGVSMQQFQGMMRQAAADADARAIVLEIDSPGGIVEQVQESAAIIRASRAEGRPIVAVANTMAASAAYWLASQADEIVVTPSGTVGSIGVFTHHDDLSEMAKREGIARTYISEGARKVEFNPMGPLSPEARAHLQARIRETYQQFTADIARGRGVPASVVRADPEASERHMGGGRAYGAAQALRLGMADRIETMDQVLARLAGGQRAPARGRRVAMARRRLALI